MFQFRIVLFLFLLGVSILGNCANTIKYRFYYATSFLHVDLWFEGSKTGRTKILLPNEWAGQQQFFLNIKNLKVHHKQGVLIDTDNPAEKVIQHTPRQSIHVSYDLFSNVKKSLDNPNDLLSPRIEKHFFYFIGINGLIVPKINEKEKFKYSFEWRLPEKWKVANSYATNHMIQRGATSLNELYDSLFMAGSFNIQHIHYKKIDFDAVVLGSFSQLDLKLYLMNCAKIINYYMNFWNDNVRYRLLAMVQLSSEEDISGGTQLNHAFILGLPKNSTFDTGYGLNALAAHELFHAWNRPDFYSFDPPHNESSVYWLSEGFTDYYAYESLYRIGLLSFSNYLKIYNEILADYYTSTVNKASNDEIEKNFWKDYFYEKLPYQRGNILAHQWNRAIILESKGRYSLDNLMKDIKGKRYSVTDINHVSKKYLKYGINGDVQKYINKGKIIPLLPDTFGHSAKLIFKKMKVKQDVFPVKYNPETFKVEWIKTGSDAEKAGLRVGDKIIDYDYVKFDVNYPVTLIVLRNGQKIKISYKINKIEWVDVPQFQKI